MFLDNPEMHEGLLHCLRIKIVCNKFLRSRALKYIPNTFETDLRLKLYEFVRSQPFVRRLWRPPKFSAMGDLKGREEELTVHNLGNKTLADVVEAMIGAGLVANGLFEQAGLESALQIAVIMGISVGGAKHWDDYPKIYVPPTFEYGAHVFHPEDQRQIEELIGYKFRNPRLLIQAYTHASTVNTNSPCYQRIEFLGDAVLEVFPLLHLADR